ncbi:TPA: helix-turn-helix domain-containing protein, partial [Proteus mirabilis]|nr:helix-turn-helix domain-containing protein [Proteus mirabilis]HCZ8288087.1 helix-turn-helix domain-containing protein [Proteus mirabilis]HCZ8422186.1 helix-turn-helix domain-containing protein [Proteus mirabilis]HCZ8426138.1 helix-turn-helix domain-containing protein [Proteus mirabilis]HCZ8591679.1 helix-turn-helix domain-containing protein [Proteus mirabilis]
QPIENAPNAQSATGESHNSDFAEQQNERPRQDKTDGGDETNPQFDPTEITTYITTDITDGTSGEPDDKKSSSKIKLNYENIINSYHDILSDMPAIKVMTDERKRKLRNFWIKFKFNQERWENYLSYIASNCRWMMEDRDNGRGGTWRRKNLDYLITERCYVAVKEERANDK